MSHHGQHMSTPVKGVRGSVKEAKWSKVLEGTTWDNFQERHVSVQEYGNTKFNDLTCIAYYFKHHFMLTPAAKAIGYNIGYGAGGSLAYRLKRINANSFLDAARALIKYKLIALSDIKCVLNNPIYPPKKKPLGPPPWDSIMYRWYAKRIVMESIHKWGGKRKAAKKLHVKLIVVQYWVALDAKDPMIRAVQS